MQKVSFLIVFVATILVLLVPTGSRPEVTIPKVEAEVIEPKPTFQDKWDKLTYEEKVEWNPNNCDLTTHILWNSDGTCHKRPYEAPRAVLSAPTGDWVSQCYKWAKQAGVPLNDFAIKLLERESHCNPLAKNPTSSAGGLAQALPWTKMGCDLSYEDAVCQMNWFWSYVQSRYGTFENALAHSYSKGWY